MKKIVTLLALEAIIIGIIACREPTKATPHVEGGPAQIFDAGGAPAPDAG